jgi:DNA adenine methylase
MLHQVEGLVVLSGYPSALYDELFAGWQTVSKTMHDNGNNSREEYLWLSPRTVAALARAQADRIEDLPLFVAAAGNQEGLMKGC